MTKQQKLLRRMLMMRSKSHKKYWGMPVLGTSEDAIRKPINFKRMLQARHQNATVPGRDEPDLPSEDITA